MIYILNVGYYSFAFPSMRGLQTVIEVLSKARRLEHCYFPGCESDPERLVLDEKPTGVCLHIVNGVSFASGKTRREVIEPEVLPRQRDGEPDAMFAMRALKGRPSAKKTAMALDVIRRERLAGEFRHMLGEGK